MSVSCPWNSSSKEPSRSWRGRQRPCDRSSRVCLTRGLAAAKDRIPSARSTLLGHLIHGEETEWIPRARIILEHGPSRPFPPFDRFAFREVSKGKSPADLLDTFETLRAKNIASLKALDLGAEQLDLVGTHPELGSVTLRQLLATWTVHDLAHLGQIARVMAKQYGTEVGPWKEFLPVLTRR